MFSFTATSYQLRDISDHWPNSLITFSCDFSFWRSPLWFHHGGDLYRRRSNARRSGHRRSRCAQPTHRRPVCSVRAVGGGHRRRRPVLRLQLPATGLGRSASRSRHGPLPGAVPSASAGCRDPAETGVSSSSAERHRPAVATTSQQDRALRLLPADVRHFRKLRRLVQASPPPKWPILCRVGR